MYDYDGAVIHNETFWSNIITHELGHALNLYHTFNGDGGGLYCPLDTNCLINGDKVCDTPPHKISECISTICPDDYSFYNSQWNYMSYCPQYLFTNGQKERMHGSFEFFSRKTLLDHSWVCDPATTIDVGIVSNVPANIYLNTNCTIDPNLLQNMQYRIVNYSDSIINYVEVYTIVDDIPYDTLFWNGILMPDSSTLIDFDFTIPEEAISITVFSWNPNEINQYDGNPENDKTNTEIVYMEDNNNYCQSFANNFLDYTPNNGWIVNTTQPSATWYDFPTSTCYSYGLNYWNLCSDDPFGEQDSTGHQYVVTSYNIDSLSNYADLILSFDRLHQYHESSAIINLNVVGYNCNLIMDTLLYIDQNEFSTKPGLGACGSYAPTVCTNWVNEEVSICQNIDQYYTVLFDFYSTAGAGWFWLDNICLTAIDKPNITESLETCNTSITLNANPILNGFWSLISGEGGIISNINNPNSLFTGLNGNVYTLSWNYLNTNCGVLYADTTTVYLNGIDSPEIFSEDSYCEGDTIHLITNPIVDVIYQWVGPDEFVSNEFNPDIIEVDSSNEGNYLLYLTNTEGCSSITTINFININDLPEIPEIIYDGELEFCYGDSIMLHSTVSDGILWSTGETDEFIFVEVSGEYTVIAENICAAFTSDTIEIIVNPLPELPIISITGSNNICEGDSVILTSNMLDNNTWSTGEVSNSIIVNTTGNYFVMYTDGNYCSSISLPVEIIVTNFPEANAYLLGDSLMCVGDTATLVANDADEYIWSTDETTSSINVTESGEYYVIEINNGICKDTSGNIGIEVNNLPDPTIVIEGEIEFCEGDNVELIAVDSDENYLWSNGETTQNIIVYESGNYFLTITNAFGCEAVSITTDIIVNNSPSVDFDIPDTSMCINDAPLFLTFGFPPDGIYSGEGISDEIFYPELAGTGTHSLYYTFTDLNGCSSTIIDEINVTDLPVVAFDLPFDSICYDSGMVFIAYGYPPGGEYLGPGITGDYYDPHLIGYDSEMVYYQYTDIYGCYNIDSSLITVYDCATIGIIEENKQQDVLIIQPNPNNGTFTLLLSSSYLGAIEINMFNSVGSLVFHEKNNKVHEEYSKSYNLNNFATGNYLIKVVSTNNTYVGKFIIEGN